MDDDKNIELAVQELRQRNIIQNKELFGLVGTTVDGLTIWFPDSLQRGWTDELTPINQRPKMLWEVLGLVGYFSDGNFNYLPRYNQGRELAREAKMYVMAEYTKNTAERVDKISHENSQLKKELAKLRDEFNQFKKQ